MVQAAGVEIRLERSVGMPGHSERKPESRTPLPTEDIAKDSFFCIRADASARGSEVRLIDLNGRFSLFFSPSSRSTLLCSGRHFSLLAW